MSPTVTRTTLRTLRKYSTKVQVKDSGTVSATDFTAQQAPNRVQPWSTSQISRSEIIKNPRFVQRTLETQPMPYSAMELIAKQPIRYLESGNVAVCNGNKGRHQGHPKIYINLDGPHASTCGYCGLRFAKAKHRDLIERGE